MTICPHCGSDDIFLRTRYVIEGGVIRSVYECEDCGDQFMIHQPPAEEEEEQAS